MQSALQFTEALDEEPVQKQNCDLKGIHPFRNMPDRRERTVFTNVVLAPSPYKITASPKLYAGAGVYPLISFCDFQSKNTSEARITN